MIGQLVAVAAGGAIGSAARFLVAGAASRWFAPGFPSGTLLVNIAGSFLIGMLFVLLIERSFLREIWHLALIAGVLGGFTTFSAFSLETLVLLQQARVTAALASVLFNVVGCLIAVWAGHALACRLAGAD